MRATANTGLRPFTGADRIARRYAHAIELAGDPDAGTVVVKLDANPLPWTDADLATPADVFTRRLSVLIRARDRGMAKRVAAALQFMAAPARGHA